MNVALAGAKGLTTQFGLLGVSFKELSLAFKSNGLKGVINSMAQVKEGFVTNTDIQYLKNYNAAIASGKTATEAFNSTLYGATKNAQTLALNANGAAVGLDNVKVAANTSRTAMIGAQVAATALNMALTMGLSIAIQKLIEGISYLIHYQEKAYEKAKELAAEAKEVADNEKEEYKTLNDLIGKYKELAESENRDTPEVRAEILDIQTKIKDMVGAQADNLDLVNGKLDEEINKLNQISSDKLVDVISDYKDAYKKAQKEGEKYAHQDANWVYDWDFGMSDSTRITIDFWGDDKARNEGVKLINEAWAKSGYGKAYIEYQSMDLLGLIEDSFSVFDFASEDINTKKKALDEAIKTLEDNDLADSELYSQLLSVRKEISDITKKQDKVATSYLEAITEQNAIAGMTTVDSLSAYREYRDKLKDAIKNDTTISDMLSNGLLNEDYIDSYVDSYLSTLSYLSTYYNQWQSSQNSMTEQEARRYAEEQKAKLQVAMMNTPKLSFVELMDLEDENGETFSDKVDNYVDKVGTLKNTLEKFEQEDFSNEDLYELQKEFPELIGHTDDFDAAIKKLLNDTNNNMMGEFYAQFGKLESEEDKRKLEEFMKTVLELGQVVGSTEFSIDIEAEAQGMEDFYTAVEESVSATGLSAKSIENLKERYKNLFADDPDKRQELLNKLFERSEHGIHLNVSALRELESEYENTQKAMFKDELIVLTDKYNDLTEQINECSDTSQKAQLYAKRQEVLDQINDVADLAAQYEGLTSAFNKWLEAQDTPDEDDMFKTLSDGLEDIKTLFEEGRVGVDDFREAVQMMTDMDMSTASIEELIAMYDSGIGTMEKFFTGNGEGLQDFLDMLVSVSTQAGETWATVDELGNYEFDFGVGDDSKIVEAINNMTDFQMSTEEVQILLRALSAYGFDINLDSIFSKFDLLETDFETLQSLVESANQKLIEVGATEYKFNINTDDVSDLNTQVSEIYQTVLDMYDDNGELNVKYNEEDLQSAKDILAALISQKESLNDACVLKIDTTTADDDIHNVIGKLQNFQTAYSLVNSLVAVGADTTEAQAEVDYWREEILKTDTPMLASLQLDNTSVAAMYESINEITPEMLVKAGLDETEVQAFIDKDKDSEGTVTYDVDDSEVEKFLNKNHDTDAKVIYNVNADAVWNFINNLHNDNRTVQYDVYYNHHGSASAQANGTANANGTAFRQGDWGTKDSGTALMGELGTEMIVRNGRWFTVGDDGAGFYQYKKGDIIFNHKQVQELFKNGKVTSDSGRGKVYANGTAFSSGSGTIHGKGKVDTNPSNGSSNGGSSSSGGGNSNTVEITYEKVDWVEIAIDRITRAVDKLKRKAESIYSTLSTRNRNLNKEIGTVRQEIEKNLAGADRYAKEAWNVGLRADLAEKVRNGTIDINEYDSDTADKIKEYQEWYEKMLDCQEAAEELQETLKSLYKEKFDNAVTNWTNKLEIYAHTIDRIVSRIELRTEKASKYVSPDNAVTASKENIKDYKKVINNEKKELKQLEKERNDLTNLMWDAVYNGNIAVGSEAYYEMLQQIQDVENEIDSLNQEIVENTNNLAAEFENIFNSISSKYENILSYSEKVSQKYTAQMELAEAKGLMASTYYYTQLRAQEQNNLKNLEAERKKLQDALNQAVSSGTIKVGSEAWYEMKGAIQEVDNEIINTTKDIIEYGNQIRQIQWDRFDTLQEKIKTLTDETSFLLSLLSNDDWYDDRGQLTESGLATLGLYAVDYNVLMSQANDYADEIKKLQKEMAKDPSNTDLIERYEELISKQQEAIQSAESQKQSIKKLVSDGIKAELDSLKDLITSYNDALSAEKDLYDYQKKVSEQTKNIANLQKQLSAYENDTSEETRSKLQKLRVELGEAQEQLQETQYDKYISDQKKLLDNMYEEYSDVLNARLDDIDQLISDMIDVTNQNSGTITETLKDVTDKVGYTVTDEMGKIWNGSSRNIVQVYGDRFDKGLTTVNTTLTIIANNLNTLISGGNTFASTGGKRAYATGIKRIPQNQYAWTQEGSPETIIRPSDGAILTPLKVGDSVLNGMATANLYDMMNDPSKFIRDSLFEGQSVANGANVNNTSNMSSVNLENVNFNLPNVKNYEEFIYAMQHDTKFEQFIRSISTDRIFGGSSLKKYRTM